MKLNHLIAIMLVLIGIGLTISAVIQMKPYLFTSDVLKNLLNMLVEK